MSSYDIQQLLDNPDRTGTVSLPAGEFEGCFTIKKSCTVNGGGALLWRSSGPALIVEAPNVTLNNLKIELTNDAVPDERYVSLFCKNPVSFSDVEVNGAVIGIPDEEQYWGIPKILNLGRLAADRQETFSIELYSPTEAELRCDMHDITLSRSFLSQGFNTIALTIGKIRSGSMIYGNIYIKSAANVTRKIFVSGIIGSVYEPAPLNYLLYSVDREAPRRYMNMLAGLDMDAIAEMPEPEAEQISIRLEEINEADEYPDEGYETVEIISGKRFPIAPKQYKIEFKYEYSLEKLDIDAYVFMLTGIGRVKNNSGMIFFGNDHSDCGSIRYLNAPDKRAVFIDFGRIEKDINRIVILFSIYGDDYRQNFGRIGNGEISLLCENGVHLRMKLEKNINCKTILACGLERSDGVWELVPSGKGVAMKLSEICRSYGVIVAE